MYLLYFLIIRRNNVWFENPMAQLVRFWGKLWRPGPVASFFQSLGDHFHLSAGPSDSQKKKWHRWKSNVVRLDILHFLVIENGMESIFWPAKLSPHRYSICHRILIFIYIMVILSFLLFSMGESSGKYEQNSDSNSTIRIGVVYAGSGDHVECCTSWGTALG